ncbi:MAG TPA: ClcB-like voltage-gated chloride channel protein [Chloroflexia bacterium]|nr:ClcB-like voltage-gated chloride channel protein [Chloroflexia bacterium]
MSHAAQRLLYSITATPRRIIDSFSQPEGYIMLFWAVFAGLTGALATMIFREGIQILQRLLGGKNLSVVELAESLPWYLRITYPAVGGLAAGGLLMLARRYGKGAPSDYMESIALGDGRVPARHTLLRSSSSLFTIATGGSIGREGSMVQLAAMCASITGRLIHFHTDRLRLLVACGAAAGITSAYNAPIAGAFFIAEIVLGAIDMASFGPLVVASIVANITMRALPGYHPTYEMPLFPAVPDVELLAFAGLGILAGLAAPQFLLLLDFSRARFRNTGWPLPLRLGLGGLGVGIISVWVPQVWGNGYEVVNSLLNNPWTWTAVLSVLIFKVLATAFTAGSGAVGGVFTPMLFVGAASGFLFGQGVGTVWPHASAPFAYAIAGMGAFLAVATGAPIMAILMIFEMTLSAPALLPLVLTCIVAYFVGQPFNTRVMYSVTLEHRRQRQTRGKLQKLSVKDLIKPAETVLPLTASFDELVEMLREHAVKYIYVVNDAGWFCGVVPAQEVTVVLADERDTTNLKAADLLHRDFPVLKENQGLAEALQVFLGHQSERLPVITSAAQPLLLGVAYKSSLLDAYYRLHQPLL